MTSDSAADPRFPVVFISGVGHSGSTLLGTLLNGHPDCAFLGETALIEGVEGKSCICGRPLGECEKWRPLVRVLERRRPDYLRTLTPGVYDELRASFGAKVLVDSSKTRAWRMRRSPLSPWRRAQVGYLWLVRDTRGVMAYFHRKGSVVSSILPRHLKWIRRWQRFMKRIGDRGITVFYEDLCADPRRELERVCRFMDLPFDEGMLRPVDHELHYTHANRLQFLGRGNEIRLDERWREELSADLLEEIGHHMSRSRFLRERYLTPAGGSPRS